MFNSGLYLYGLQTMFRSIIELVAGDDCGDQPADAHESVGEVDAEELGDDFGALAGGQDVAHRLEQVEPQRELLLLEVPALAGDLRASLLRGELPALGAGYLRKWASDAEFLLRSRRVSTSVDSRAISQKVAPILLNFLGSLLRSLMVDRMAMLSKNLRKPPPTSRAGRPDGSPPGSRTRSSRGCPS